MKKFRKLTVTICLFIFLQLCLTMSVCAQIINPGCDPDCNCYKDGTPCPIDGDVVVLIALGAAYGIKKIINVRKANVEAF